MNDMLREGIAEKVKFIFNPIDHKIVKVKVTGYKDNLLGKLFGIGPINGDLPFYRVESIEHMNDGVYIQFKGGLL